MEKARELLQNTDPVSYTHLMGWHSSTPKAGDYTEEYQAYYHEKMLETFESRPYLWGTFLWNMFDFAADARDEGGCKGRNNKGIVTFDRKVKKDSFYPVSYTHL